MARSALYLCGTPNEHCTGSKYTITSNANMPSKAHSSRDEAFRCYKRHLLRLGYTQVGSREFQAPNGGRVLVLSKKSRFGGRLRSGKENNRYMHDNCKGTITG